jgi:hypothetical protein
LGCFERDPALPACSQGRCEVALSLRGAIFTQQLSGEDMATGSRSVFLTARLVLE